MTPEVGRDHTSNHVHEIGARAPQGSLRATASASRRNLIGIGADHGGGPVPPGG